MDQKPSVVPSLAELAEARIATHVSEHASAEEDECVGVMETLSGALQLPPRTLCRIRSHLAAANALSPRLFLASVNDEVGTIVLRRADVRGLPLDQVGQFCPRLRELDLSDAILPADGPFVSAIAAFPPSLRRISLDHTNATDTMVGALLDHCAPHLEDFSVGWCGSVSDTGLAGVALCKRLRRLHIGGTAATHRTVELATACPAMKSLSTKSMFGLERLPRAFHCGRPWRLEHLSLHGIHHVTSAAIVAFLRPSQQSLRSLNLAETEITAEGLKDWVTGPCAAGERESVDEGDSSSEVGPGSSEDEPDSGSAASRSEPDLVGQHEGDTVTLPLQVLDVSWCDEMEEDAIMVAARHCPDLRRLSTRCVPVSDRLAVSLATYCSELRSVSVARSDGVTDTGIRALCDGCPKLTSASFAWCLGVTDAGVEYLMHHLPRLRWLDMEGCKAILPDIVRILDESPHRDRLQFLGLGWCNAAGKELVAELQQRCLLLSVLDYFQEEHPPIVRTRNLLPAT